MGRLEMWGAGIGIAIGVLGIVFQMEILQRSEIKSRFDEIRIVNGRQDERIGRIENRTWRVFEVIGDNERDFDDRLRTIEVLILGGDRSTYNPSYLKPGIDKGYLSEKY